MVLDSSGHEKAFELLVVFVRPRLMGGGARKMRWLVSEFRCFVIVFSERVGLSKNNDVAKGCYQTIPLTWLCLSFSDSNEWAFFGLFENTDIRYILSQVIFSAETLGQFLCMFVVRLTVEQASSHWGCWLIRRVGTRDPRMHT